MFVTVLLRWPDEYVFLKMSSNLLTLWSDSCSTYCVLLTLIIFNCQFKDKEQWNFHSYRLNITVTAKKIFLDFFVNSCHCLKKVTLTFYYHFVPCLCSDVIMKILTKCFVFSFHEELKAIDIIIVLIFLKLKPFWTWQTTILGC